ncbi:MAG: hypothetical protein IJ814_02610 [Paludibacteraceae bacterium]|nr:hypothetical protein [Paludibacteraceae bacterium]
MSRLIQKIAAKFGIYPYCVKIINSFKERKEAKAVKKHGIEVLQLVNDILEPEGVRPFLYAGLLLGAYREHNFIPYDFDLDLGILASERPDNIVQIMQKNGFKWVRQFYFKEDNSITIDQFNYKGVPVDFYYFFEVDEQTIASFVPKRHEYKEWSEANETDGFPCDMDATDKTDLTKQEFLGHYFYMPNNAEQFLKDLYGDDFMQPIKGWTNGTRKTRRYPYHMRQYRRKI